MFDEELTVTPIRIAAYCSMYLAYSLDQILTGVENVHDPRTKTLRLIYVSAHSFGVLGSLSFLAGRIELCSRSWLLLAASSFGCGILAHYFLRQHSTAWTVDLFNGYQTTSIGCSFGTVLGTLILGFWLRYLQPATNSGKGCE